MLASVGIAAVGCSAGTAFRQADADRFTALSQLTPAVPESLEPTLLPPSRPVPLGPLSHNTLSVQQQPSTDPPLAERQHSAGLAMPARPAGPRGRSAKEPKLSGINAPFPLMFPPNVWQYCCRNKCPMHESVHGIACCKRLAKAYRLVSEFAGLFLLEDRREERGGGAKMCGVSGVEAVWVG